jgi:protein gp37
VSAKTTIEWTRSDDGTAGATWNPVTGCTEVSDGCDRCYAKTFAERWRGVPGHYFENGFDVQLRPDKLTLPLRWRKPRRVFVNSMSDLFHADVPDEYIAAVFAVMAATPQHTYQILTKRHARMRSLLRDGGVLLLDATSDEATVREIVGAHWPLPNVHLGVSVEDQKSADIRIPALMHTEAEVRFISAEPLLGPIDLRGRVPDWLIAGAESGPGARPMHHDWVRALRDQCTAAGMAFFYKQDAVRGKKIPTPLLDGRTWTQMPAAVSA